MAITKFVSSGPFTMAAFNGMIDEANTDINNITPAASSYTLTAAGWDSSAKTQTITVSGVLADESAQFIVPTPKTTSMTAYYDAGILCTAQAANSLTFTATTVPTEDLTIYVYIQKV